MMPRGMANNMAKSAALIVPIDSGTRLILASEASLPEEACQMYSGPERPSYQTFCHNELKEISGWRFQTSSRINFCSLSMASMRPLIGEIAKCLTELSVMVSISSVREDVP